MSKNVISTILTPLVGGAIVATSIAALWGAIDWRWIPTAVLLGLLVLFLGGFADSQLEKRAERRAAQRAAQERTERLANGTPTNGDWLVQAFERMAKDLNR